MSSISIVFKNNYLFFYVICQEPLTTLATYITDRERLEAALVVIAGAKTD
jgi:hypothetical protein